MNSRQGLTIIIVILLLLLMGAAYWGYTTNQDKKALTEQNEQLNQQMGDLTALKENLQTEVDSLQNAYASLAEENESLQGSVDNAQHKIAEKEAIIRRLKKQTATANNSLQVQIQELLGVKAELETSINNLQVENDSLFALTGQLTADLAQAKTENEALANLNKTIQEELKRLTLANFKASAFRVEVEKRRPKATAKARRAKRLQVSFDLTGVVAKYQGVRPVYLVVTDDKGTPIKTENPIMAKVNVNNSLMDIQAVKEQDVNIGENQRLSFSYDLKEKLRPGYYRVAVYTDIGLLGAASFRLQ
jgi:peptidoglycan hydrolase CwlO-like protein